MTRLGFVVLVVQGLAACGAPEPYLPRPPDEPNLVVRFEPDAAPDAVPEVLRIHVEGASERTRAAPLRLFSGELSNYHIGRIKKRDYPKTLLEREIGAESWSDGEGVLTIAPSRVLELGASYSLASEVSGLVAAFRVRSEAGPRFERLWPEQTGEGEVAGGQLLSYCSTASSAAPGPIGALELELEPFAIAARAAPGIDASGFAAERCFHLAPNALPPEGSLLIPPPELFGALVDPQPVRVLAEAAPEPLSCTPAEVAFGPACATIHDDRLIVKPPLPPLLWVLTDSAVSESHVSRDGLPFVVRGLVPETRQVVRGAVYDLHGTGERLELEFETGPPERHLVLNEVLANPIGPEPAQEWVEIVNDGELPCRLSGIVLEDVGGAAALPDLELKPSEYALLVAADFDEALGFDLAPHPGTRLLRLTALGKSGLSNSGEPLRLRDAMGLVLSSFPALASEKAGISLARSTPVAFDADPKAFGAHAEAGASPGAPNVLSAQ